MIIKMNDRPNTTPIAGFHMTSLKWSKIQTTQLLILLITGSGWDIRSAQILHALKWESLADRRERQLKSLMFKTANNLVPEYLSDKFTSVTTIHRHNLRGAQQNLFIPRYSVKISF